MGSLGVKYDLTNQMMSTRGALDERGNRQVVREWFAASVGWRNVDKYVPPVDRNRIPSNETSHAVLENNDFLEGRAVPVGTDQMHQVHILAHFQVVAELSAGLQGQAPMPDPATAARGLELTIQHIQQHAQLLEQDPARNKEFLQQVKAGLQEAQQLLSVLQQQAQEAQRAQEQAQQQVADAQQVLANRELETKIHEINMNAQLEAAKQQSLNDMRAQKTDEQMDIAREKAAADIRLKGERQAAELANEAAKTRAEIALKRASAG
jgi:hypothetical protein